MVLSREKSRGESKLRLEIIVADNEGRFWIPIGNECSIFAYASPLSDGNTTDMLQW